MEIDRDTLTIEEARRRLGIGRSLAYELARTGRLGPVPVLKVGRRLLVPRKALERALAGEVATPANGEEGGDGRA